MKLQSERIEALLDHLRRGHRQRYDGFIRCLVQTRQEHIAKNILGECVDGLTTTPENANKETSELPNMIKN